MRLMTSHLVRRYDEAKVRYDELSKAIIRAETLALEIDDTISTLGELGPVVEWDETLWGSLVEEMVVNSKEDFVVRLRGGIEI